MSNCAALQIEENLRSDNSNHRLIRLRKILTRSENYRDQQNEFGETSLFVLLKDNATDESIETLIDQGCVVNKPNNKGVTPLHLAVERNTPNVTLKLIQKGVDVNAKDKDGLTALHRTILHNRIDTLMKLLNLPRVAREKKNKLEETPLSLSLRVHCTDEIVATLIQNNCNVNIPNSNRISPIHMAVSRTTDFVTQKLIEKQANINAKDNMGNAPLHAAVQHQSMVHIKLLLNQRKIALNERNKLGYTPLFLSLKMKCEDELIFILIDHGCKVNIPDKQGLTPLHLAVERETTMVACKLIQKGAIINVKDKIYGAIPLHRAVLKHRLDMVRELLKLSNNSVDQQDKYGRTPLSESLRVTCNDEMIGTLIDHGCNVNLASKCQETPLHIAVQRDTDYIAQKLIERGANVNAKTHWGDTPLHEAIMNWRSHTIIITLLNSGSDIHVTNKMLATALHMIVQRNTYAITHQLIQMGANIHAKDYFSVTPLHMAAYKGQIGNVHILLYYGANAEEKDICGRTSLGYAFQGLRREMFPDETFHYEVIECLIKYTIDFSEKDHYGFSLMHKIFTQFPNLAMDAIENGADVNVMSHGHHCINISLLQNYQTSDVFEAAWKRIKIKKLIKSKYCSRYLVLPFQSFLEGLLSNKSFSDEQFLKCLYMIFESPCIEHFIEQYLRSQKRCAFIHIIFSHRNYDLETRLNIIYLLLSHDLRIYFIDLCTLYEKYGFDETVEAILKHGCFIYPYNDIYPFDLVLRKICYDNFDVYFYKQTMKRFRDFHECAKLNFKQFFKGAFLFGGSESNLDFDQPFYEIEEFPSLLQLSRDTVRRIMFKKWRTRSSFKIYQAISQLPVPSDIKDILFLKKPIYYI